MKAVLAPFLQYKVQYMYFRSFLNQIPEAYNKINEKIIHDRQDRMERYLSEVDKQCKDNDYSVDSFFERIDEEERLLSSVIIDLKAELLSIENLSTQNLEKLDKKRMSLYQIIDVKKERTLQIETVCSS